MHESGKQRNALTGVLRTRSHLRTRYIVDISDKSWKERVKAIALIYFKTYIYLRSKKIICVHKYRFLLLILFSFDGIEIYLLER